MTMMNTKTPKTAAMLPGEDRPEPETNIRAVKAYVDVNMKTKQLRVSMASYPRQSGLWRWWRLS